MLIFLTGAIIGSSVDPHVYSKRSPLLPSPYVSLRSRSFGKPLAKRNEVRMEEAIEGEHSVVDIGLMAHPLRPTGKVFLQRGLRSLVYPSILRPPQCDSADRTGDKAYDGPNARGLLPPGQDPF